MKSNSTTQTIAYVALAVFGIYALMAIGMAGFMFSVALGLVVFSAVDSVEVATAIVIITGLIFKYFFGPVTKSVVASTTEGFSTDSLQTIAGRVKSIQKALPIATYSSSFVEGFADADSVTKGKAEGEQKSTDASAANSKPAEAKPAAEKFEGQQQPDGLFKLGEIPTEAKGGPHIDQGTTLMNAISSLKPEQIQAMTEDTRKLLDTQKNLMGMLSTMKPMLNDGKQLMDTFQQMFGPGAAGATN